MKLAALALLLISGIAQAAPTLHCKSSNGSVTVAPAGNGAVSAIGSYTNEEGKQIAVACVGDLISFNEVPGFGKQVETFRFHGSAGCAFEFMQLDDTAYQQRAGGPMRLTCNQGSCAVRNFVCQK